MEVMPLPDDAKQERKDVAFVIHSGKVILEKIKGGITTNNAIALAIPKDAGTVSRHIKKLISLGLVAEPEEGRKPANAYPKLGEKGRTVKGEKKPYVLTDDGQLVLKVLQIRDRELMENAILEVIRRSRSPTVADEAKLEKLMRLLSQAQDDFNRNIDASISLRLAYEEVLKLNTDHVYSWAEKEETKTLIKVILSKSQLDQSKVIGVQIVRGYLIASRYNKSWIDEDLIPWLRTLVLKDRTDAGMEALLAISDLVRKEGGVSEDMFQLLLESTWLQHSKDYDSSATSSETLIAVISNIWPNFSATQRLLLQRAIKYITVAKMSNYRSAIEKNQQPRKLREVDAERLRVLRLRLDRL
jgi:DNA-binding transcriptional ArsR family regulator